MTVRSRSHLLVGVATAMLFGCKAATVEVPTETVADVRAVIEASNASFVRYAAAGYADSVAALYHEDGALMLSHEPIATGRDAIQKTFAGLFAMANIRATLTTESVALADSLATERGTFRLELRDKADSTKTLGVDTGNYVVEWRKRAGEWRMHWDIAATDVPMAPPAAQ